MTAITILYIALMIAALVWLGWKIKQYLEKERDRENRLDEEMLYDDTFKSYVEDLKKKRSRDATKGSTQDADKFE
jgi:nitrogen fixation-related uncharacterized protein